MALAFNRESSDFLAGVNVERKETFDTNQASMPGVALSAPGRVGPRVSLFDNLIGIISGGLLDSFAEKISGLRFLVSNQGSVVRRFFPRYTCFSTFSSW